MPYAPNTAAAAVACSASLFALAAALSLSGCGTPGAPQPPSLRLPEPVADLSATRTGDVVSLHWTMTRRTTDRLLLASQIHGPIPAILCRREQASAPCQPVGEAAFEPGVEGQFRETLPATLASGPLRPLLYYVELKSRSGAGGRSAGMSNTAMTAAGSAPAAPTGFTAEVRADGVALHWNAGATAGEIRLHRHLLTPLQKPDAKDAKSSGSFAKPVPEALDRELLVAASTPEGKPAVKSGAMDATVRFGATYEYTAQRVDRLKAGDAEIELTSEPTAPIQIAVVDTFPPAVPAGLAAVFVPDEKTIDLSWQPDAEPDLDGYIVYRAEQYENRWTKVSGEKPLTEPAFRDSTIQAGHSYRYAVSAIDQTGHESARSSEAQESVPNP